MAALAVPPSRPCGPGRVGQRAAQLAALRVHVRVGLELLRGLMLRRHRGQVVRLQLRMQHLPHPVVVATAARGHRPRKFHAPYQCQKDGAHQSVAIYNPKYTGYNDVNKTELSMLAMQSSSLGPSQQTRNQPC